MPEPFSPSFAVQLEIIADNQYPANPATLDTISSEIIKELNKAGYKIEPLYTGTRGSELFKVVLDSLTQHGADIALFISTVATIIEGVKTIQELYTNKKQEPPTITITTKLNEQTLLTIEGQDAEEIKNILERAQNDLNTSPQLLSIPSKRTVTIYAQQPKKRKNKKK